MFVYLKIRTGNTLLQRNIYYVRASENKFNVTFNFDITGGWTPRPGLVALVAPCNRQNASTANRHLQISMEPYESPNVARTTYLHSPFSFLNSTCRNAIRTATGNGGILATQNQIASPAEDTAEQAIATADDAVTVRPTALENCSQRTGTEHLRKPIPAISRARERVGGASRQARRPGNRYGVVAWHNWTP
jgi:hypothetical protein